MDLVMDDWDNGRGDSTFKGAEVGVDRYVDVNQGWQQSQGVLLSDIGSQMQDGGMGCDQMVEDFVREEVLLKENKEKELKHVEGSCRMEEVIPVDVLKEIEDVGISKGEVLKLLSEMEMCDGNGEDLWEGMKEADEGGHMANLRTGWSS
jgi:hypothetical protein